ncbi:glutaredoxin family protein [Sinimarinibacterium sp. CAU 1509]|uniref:glutaredoxin family protein n=1 Tax=Sinimarinibacterium sp. CAU 1509 TaxID=2562283 RepID=UPI0010AC9607|nr:glutaredoxin family protein [Sinimarinibacterium sp. CAU 1509]TJY63070.1 glutaredoxin family protein [Sinimarinibacterium sp. CAU 1509]
MRLLLLGRPGCHLCEDFAEDLQIHLAGRAFELEHADVDSTGEWRMRYGRRIPVLLDAQGRVLSEGQFDAERFERSLAA